MEDLGLLLDYGLMCPLSLTYYLKIFRGRLRTTVDVSLKNVYHT